MRFSKLLIVFNPIAGSGKGSALTERYRNSLERVGYHVAIVESRANYSDAEADSLLAQRDAVIVVGGDGTLQTLLPHLARLKKPVYMLPAGNESLFAREFGMVAEMKPLEQALAQGLLSPCYFGYAGKRPFFHMASVGFDADVVFRISQTRRGPIGHSGYFLPTLATFFRQTPPRITLKVDGAPKLSGERGFLIVANTPAYAARMLFVPEADSKSPLLYARFFPLESTVGFALLALQSRFSKATNWPSCQLYKGREFVVSTDNLEGVPTQADGDYAGQTPITISKGNNQILVCLPTAMSKK